jgi:hypothetical protein
MENKNDILQELMEISPAVANLGRENTTYTVPPNYFETLPELVLARIKEEEISFGVKTTPFAMPQGYFEGLADNILNSIKQQDKTVEEELNEVAPLLNTISKQPVYQVPQGYFESLEITMPMAVAKPTAEVFGIGVKRVFQYALAACTAGILIIGAYMYTGSGNSEEQAVISHASAMKMDVAKELSTVSEDELNEYLDENPSVGYAFTNTSSLQEELNVDQYIQEASDEDIEQYLDETPASPSTGTGS